MSKLPHCKACDNVEVYTVIIGVAAIAFLLLVIILQYVTVVLYHQNKAQIDAIVTILNEIVIFMNNISDTIGYVEGDIDDLTKLITAAAKLAGDIAKLMKF